VRQGILLARLFRAISKIFFCYVARIAARGGAPAFWGKFFARRVWNAASHDALHDCFRLARNNFAEYFICPGRMSCP
jgi:hypothetical protein